jgi:hypothetical protein
MKTVIRNLFDEDNNDDNNDDNTNDGKRDYGDDNDLMTTMTSTTKMMMMMMTLMLQIATTIMMNDDEHNDDSIDVPMCVDTAYDDESIIISVLQNNNKGGYNVGDSTDSPATNESEQYRMVNLGLMNLIKK